MKQTFWDTFEGHKKFDFGINFGWKCDVQSLECVFLIFHTLVPSYHEKYINTKVFLMIYHFCSRLSGRLLDLLKAIKTIKNTGFFNVFRYPPRPLFLFLKKFMLPLKTSEKQRNSSAISIANMLCL